MRISLSGARRHPRDADRRGGEALSRLDDLDAIERLDSLGVLTVVERFADQCRAGWELGRAAAALPDGDGVDSIAVLGMGGSGVAGDVAGAVLRSRLPVFYEVLKDYGPLPEWVGRNTLVVAISYSGNTEETIAAYEAARARGARVVVIASGGRLGSLAQEEGGAQVQIPSGLQPRAALGYLALPLLAVLTQMGLAPDLSEDVDEAGTVLDDVARRCNRRAKAAENPAKDIARRLAGRLPVVYGAGLSAVAAMRFKCDLNEYAETPAFYNVVPELDHNELQGWRRAEVSSHDLALVLLRDNDEPERIAARFQLTRGIIETCFSDVIEVTAEGRSALARLLSLIFVTQLASIYLAVERGVDPGPVEALDILKARLAER